MEHEHPVISAFQRAARRVPAYRHILEQHGVDPAQVTSLDDFRARVPVIDKESTFLRFGLAELCRDGRLGRLAGLLTSSGHSGRFAFGVYDAESAAAEIQQADDALDMLFGVRSRTTLLINCLPMGVYVPTRSCTVAQTSVRSDMVTEIVKHFADHYDQIIMVAEAAFMKHVLELGQDRGIKWQDLLVHVVLGEEPLAENARKYLQGILGCDIDRPEKGFVGSSMGVAELGLNLFFELPGLIAARRICHDNPALLKAVCGESATTVPLLFTYDPHRVFVEVMDGQGLVVSTLDSQRVIPLIRYRTGDSATLLDGGEIAQRLGWKEDMAKTIVGMPVIAVHGRGQSVQAGTMPVYPEWVKEGIYYDAELARLTTANFRLASGPDRALVRIQLAPGVQPDDTLAARFSRAIRRYVPAEIEVKCQAYYDFKDGMSLDYERKFAYVEE